MALLNSKSPWRSAGIEQLSCRLARTSGRWAASPISRCGKAARPQIVEPFAATCPVSLSKVMAEAGGLFATTIECHGRASSELHRLEYIVS